MMIEKEALHKTCLEHWRQSIATEENIPIHSHG
jgi:hypothetical protein